MTKPNPSSEPTVKQEGCCKLGISSSSPFIPPTYLSTQQVSALSPAPLESGRRRADEAFGLPDGRAFGWARGRGGRDASGNSLPETRSPSAAATPAANLSPGSRPALFHAPFLFALAAAQSGAAVSSGRAGWRASSTAAPAPQGHPRRLYLRSGAETRPRSR